MNYPEIDKLKQKYSPQKRIPPPSNSANYEQLAQGARRVALAPEGGFHPIKRSGSPVRRQNINQLEQRDRLKSAELSESEARRPKRSREDDDEQTVPKKTKSVTFDLENVQPRSSDHSYEAVLEKLDTCVNTVNQRLDVLEATQQKIIAKIEGTDLELHLRCDELQQSLDSLRSVFKENNK